MINTLLPTFAEFLAEPRGGIDPFSSVGLLIIGIGLLIIMRYRPQGVIPEKIIKH